MDGRALNVVGVQQLIGSDTNKQLKATEGFEEGVSGATIPELELSMDDTELLALSSKWSQQYFNYEGSLKKKQETAKKYWLGQQNVNLTADGRPIYDNLIFQSLETFLPQATSQNPVSVSNAGPDAIDFAKNIDGMNAYHSDRLGLRYLLKDMARHWSIYYLGVLKVGWDDVDSKDITLEHIHSQRIMIDPESKIDFKGRPRGRWVAERKTVMAQDLIDMFKSNKEYISESVHGLLGTNVTYTEWWTPDYCFYTYNKIVLAKMKNPHWNWDDKKDGKDLIHSPYEDELDIELDELPNHFSHPQVPYIFLTVFNMGEHPHDDTSLLEQNQRAQDLIQDRNEQITMNVTAMNNSLAFAGPQFTREQAKQGNKAVNQGQGIFVPNGPIATAVQRLAPSPIPSQVFENLDDIRNEMQNVWGVRGLSPSGQEDTETVRGRMQNQQYDSSRIGGTITEAIEQVADSVFNWFDQLYCVYYDVKKTVAIIGSTKGVQQATLQQSDFLDKAVVTTVVPNSMLPKDPVSKANNALNMWEAGLSDPISTLVDMDVDDPVGRATKLFLWKTNPIALFPELQQQMQQQQDQQSIQEAPPQSGSGAHRMLRKVFDQAIQCYEDGDYTYKKTLEELIEAFEDMKS